MSEVRPLEGRTVAICRSAEKNRALRARLEVLGAEVTSLALTETVPPLDGGEELRQRLADVERYDWLALTSGAAVRYLSAAAPVWPLPLPFAVVGAATARAVEASGAPVSFVAPEATARTLAASLPADVGDRVLAPLAEAASDDLARGLRQRGVDVDVVVAYRLAAAADIDDRDIMAAGACDAVMFASPSAVTGFLDSGTTMPPVIASIGPRTSAAVTASGFDVTAEAAPHNEDGLIAALIAAISSIR